MPANLPAHIAIIMDGNGRWAAARGVTRAAGHKAGAQAAQDIVRAARDIGIKFITLYAFSTENWKRSPAEISALMKLLGETLDKYSQGKEEGVRIVFSGRRAKLPKAVLAKMDSVAVATASARVVTLNLALNYGGRQEVIDAANTALAAGKKKISEADINKNLYAPQLPPPDLIIRTSGEMRLSNFLLWQAAYSELYFTDVLWPDFGPKQLRAALKAYAARHRRYGAR